MSACTSVISALQTLLSSSAWDETERMIYHHETLHGIFNTHTRAQNSHLHAYLSYSATHAGTLGVIRGQYWHILAKGERLGLYAVENQPSGQPLTQDSHLRASHGSAGARLRGKSLAAPGSRSAAGHNCSPGISLGTTSIPLSILRSLVLERLSKVN